MYCGLPASSTHGIFQARVLEWVAIVFSLLIVSKTETQTITMSVPSLPCIRLVKFERIITVTVGGEINTHNLVVYLTYIYLTYMLSVFNLYAEYIMRNAGLEEA